MSAKTFPKTKVSSQAATGKSKVISTGTLTPSRNGGKGKKVS